MNKKRTLSLTVAALTLTACAHNARDAATRFETSPLAFVDGAVTSGWSAEEQQRQAHIAHRKAAPHETVSARSTISLL